MMNQAKQNESQRTVTGTVVSSKRNKTISLAVERKVKHKIYGKIITRTSKITAHDEENTCNEGDVVTVIQSRPLSKSKSWTLLRINRKVESEL
jgi:small subunit ribosomal protein S17